MIWVPIGAVIAIHDRQIARHGGAAGMRYMGLLENALARPMNANAYGVGDVHALAAGYAFGIAKAHAFVDGNKRTAFVTAATFLRLNGHAFRPDPEQVERAMNDIASGALSEGGFADWLARGSRPLAD